jgi:hypothetical protein
MDTREVEDYFSLKPFLDGAVFLRFTLYLLTFPFVMNRKFTFAKGQRIPINRVIAHLHIL